MFAFAVLDRARRQVVLARDRYGVKPLYYAFRGGSLLFASEIKALLRHPDCRAELDEDALARILHLPELPGRPHALPRDSDPARRLHADRRSRRADRRKHPEVLGFQVRGARAAVRRRRGVRARARPALPAGGRPAARERRAGGLVSQRGNGHRRGHLSGERADAGDAHLHDRLRPQLGLRPRARVRRAVAGRADLVPARHRAVRDGVEGRRHAAGHAGRRAPHRGAARRAELPELLRGEARRQLREGRALGCRRRRAVRRLSLAVLSRGVRAPGSTTTSTGTSGSGSGSSPKASSTSSSARFRTAVAWNGRARSSRACSTACAATSTRPRTTSTSRSTSRPRPFSTGYSSSRTS